MTKSCLILSYGPIPSPEHAKVEGGGLRCWGLAKGLRDNEPDLEITVAYNESYKTDNFTDRYQSIDIKTWDIDSVAELIQDYDTVLVSYCMGDLSVKVADTIRPDQQLILDCYVPIYVEVSARSTSDLETEYTAFHNDAGRWAHVLERGDIFLCASEQQKQYYKGVLSAVARINPATYGTDFIRVVPYGIYREKPNPKTKPITDLIGKDKNVKKILWFGGIYPWFDLKNLIDATKLVNKSLPAKLIIVGAKNPFNDHPDFVRPYEELIAHIKADPVLKDQVILQDWVSFDSRADWYMDSDLVVAVNKLGDENSLAWRTRLVDFMWADLPVITNGGDPLGEILLDNKAALRLSGLSSGEIAEDLLSFLKNEEVLKDTQKNLNKLKPRFYWDVITNKLAEDILSHTKAYDLEEFGAKVIAPPQVYNVRNIRGTFSKAKMIPAYTKKYGARNTYFAVRTKVHNQLKKTKLGRRTSPKIVMIAHQLDRSGAPYVFLDLTKELVNEVPSKQIEFHTFNPSHKDNIALLNKIGIKPNIHLSKDIEMTFTPGDAIVLNTAAHPAPLLNSIYTALEQGTAEKLVWFIHEDEPEFIFKPTDLKRLKNLLANDKIFMFIAAEKALKNYQSYFDNQTNIKKQPYKYVIPDQFQKIRSEKDFDKLSFILPGTVGDGRKGQLPVFYALAEFYEQYFQADPSAYRDFELVYVGMSDDFLSRQILKHAEKLFGNRFISHGLVSHQKSSELMMKSNVTVCYSIRECLPLFVFEGMAAGHPILRNDSSGIDEQLFKGKNGLYLETENFTQVVEAFEQVLNKQKTSNKLLASMSAYSNKVALKQADNSYQPMTDQIIKGLPKK